MKIEGTLSPWSQRNLAHWQPTVADLLREASQLCRALIDRLEVVHREVHVVEVWAWLARIAIGRWVVEGKRDVAACEIVSSTRHACTRLPKENRVEACRGLDVVHGHDYTVQSHHGHTANCSAARRASQEGTFRFPSAQTSCGEFRQSPRTGGVPALYGRWRHRRPLEADAVPAPIVAVGWLR